MDCADFLVRLSGEEGIQVVCGLALFHFPHRLPVRHPDASKERNGAAFVQRKPSACFLPSGNVSGLAKLVNGTKHLFAGPSQRF